MPESIRDQIIDAIVDQLEEIVGDAGVSFWYTPGAVRVVEAVNQACLDDTFADPTSGKATIYLLVPDDEQDIEETTEDIDAIMNLDLVVARQIDQVDHPLKTASSGSRSKIQNRLARDAKKKLREDVTLGGLSHNVEIVRSEFGPEEVYAAGWAVVLMRLSILYSYWRTTP